MLEAEIIYGVASLPPRAASAAQIEALWRGQWTIENWIPHVRDVMLGEDAGPTGTGTAPRALGAPRNAVLNLLRALGSPLIPDALRHYGAYAHRAVPLFSTSPPRL